MYTGSKQAVLRERVSPPTVTASVDVDGAVAIVTVPPVTSAGLLTVAPETAMVVPLAPLHLKLMEVMAAAALPFPPAFKQISHGVWSADATGEGWDSAGTKSVGTLSRIGKLN
jgi:hypothetical protein